MPVSFVEIKKVLYGNARALIDCIPTKGFQVRSHQTDTTCSLIFLTGGNVD